MPVRSFADTLRALNDGRTMTELTDQLAALVQAVRTHGKKGSITITLAVEPANDDMINIVDTVKASIPTPARKKSYFYADDDGGLHRGNPRQTTMELREVDKPAAGGLREVSRPSVAAENAAAATA